MFHWYYLNKYLSYLFKFRKFFLINFINKHFMYILYIHIILSKVNLLNLDFATTGKKFFMHEYVYKYKHT